MTGHDIERWRKTRLRPNRKKMTAAYISEQTEIAKATLWRWEAVGRIQLKSTRALRYLAVWMAHYDFTNPNARTSRSIATPSI